MQVLEAEMDTSPSDEGMSANVKAKNATLAETEAAATAGLAFVRPLPPFPSDLTPDDVTIDECTGSVTLRRSLRILLPSLLTTSLLLFSTVSESKVQFGKQRTVSALLN